MFSINSSISVLVPSSLKYFKKSMSLNSQASLLKTLACKLVCQPFVSYQSQLGCTPLNYDKQNQFVTYELASSVHVISKEKIMKIDLNICDLNNQTICHLAQ